ncbi:hypothetical protein EBQ81_04540 [bacterium]|nr:hypothetical protein [bacterium]
MYSVDCEKKDWKAIGRSYAIDSDGTLWSINTTGKTEVDPAPGAGINWFNKGLSNNQNNLYQVDDSTDWDQIIDGPDDTELFLKTDGSLYTINNRIGLDILLGGGLSNGKGLFPIQKPLSYHSLQPSGYNITINTVEPYDDCSVKVAYSSSNIILAVGDSVATVGDGMYVGKVLSDSEFLTDRYFFTNNYIHPLSGITFSVRKRITGSNLINNFWQQYSDATFYNYDFGQEQQRFTNFYDSQGVVAKREYLLE